MGCLHLELILRFYIQFPIIELRKGQLQNHGFFHQKFLLEHFQFELGLSLYYNLDHAHNGDGTFIKDKYQLSMLILQN